VSNHKKPFVLNHDRPVYFDVDDTLVFWPRTIRKKGLQDEMHVTIGVSDWDESVQGNVVSHTLAVVPNWEMIEFMKCLKAQGTAIIVWSHGGVRWAEAVVKALNLEEYVDVIMTKPNLMLDDKPVEHLGKTSWSGPPDLTKKKSV
jgi:FMN phosphatase YigB (HAD superfamily)